MARKPILGEFGMFILALFSMIVVMIVLCVWADHTRWQREISAHDYESIARISAEGYCSLEIDYALMDGKITESEYYSITTVRDAQKAETEAEESRKRSNKAMESIRTNIEKNRGKL